jgi:hypothetical protein
MESNYFSLIRKVRDKLSDIEISLSSCSIQKITSTFSNTKIPIYKLVINNKPISRNNTFVVLYECQTCKLQQEITLNLFMRKVNKNTARCESCRNKDDTKCEKQSQFMKDNIHKIRSGEYIPIVNKVKSNTLEQHLQKSKNDWDNEDDEFKEHYLFTHLTDNDFARISSKIISIGNDKIKSLNDWYYYPTYRIYNQSKYTPMLIHKFEEQTEKPQYIKFKCDNCECEFVHRDLEVVKNHIKLFCQTCTLTNKKFHIRKMKLKCGDNILWQSIPERRFIEWCEENRIPVKNGPNLQYIFKDKQHTYRVDFELPDHKMLIEIKDNHCWHKDQVLSGKFLAKENSAKIWCEQNNYTYHVLFPKTIQKFKDSIIKSS